MYCTVKALTLLLESYKQRNQGLTVKNTGIETDLS